MLLIPNALCWSSRKCKCACALPAKVQLRLRVTRRKWQKLFAGKNFVKILVTAQTQLRSHSEQQRAFGNSNICNWPKAPHYFDLCPYQMDFPPFLIEMDSIDLSIPLTARDKYNILCPFIPINNGGPNIDPWVIPPVKMFQGHCNTLFPFIPIKNELDWRT